MKPVGDFARLHVAALKRAEMLQGLAMQQIRNTFAAEDDEFGPENLRWDLLVRELESARESGTMQEFQRKALEIMAPAIQQVLTEQANGGAERQ